MSQVSYGTITITDTTDLTTYIRYAKKSPLTAASDFQETPTTDTHFIAVLSMPSSDAIPAWNSTDWKWSEFIGTDGVSVLGTREIYYLKTNSATVVVPANGSDISQTSEEVENQWTKSVPTYVTNGEYWTCIQTHLDGSPTWVYGSPVLNQSLTDMNHDIDVIKSITQQTAEDAQGAMSQATATQVAQEALASKLNHMWRNQTAHYQGVSGWTKPDYPVGTYMASGIENVTFDEQDSSTYGFNSFLRHTFLSFRYNTHQLVTIGTGVTTDDGGISGLAINTPIVDSTNKQVIDAVRGMELTSNSLTFYKPPTIDGTTVTPGGKAMELTGTVLKFYRQDTTNNTDVVNASFSADEIILGEAEKEHITIDDDGLKIYGRYNSFDPYGPVTPAHWGTIASFGIKTQIGTEDTGHVIIDETGAFFYNTGGSTLPYLVAKIGNEGDIVEYDDYQETYSTTWNLGETLNFSFSRGPSDSGSQSIKCYIKEGDNLTLCTSYITIDEDNYEYSISGYTDGGSADFIITSTTENTTRSVDLVIIITYDASFAGPHYSFGMNTNSIGRFSIAAGQNTIALGKYQMVLGKFNEVKEDALFIIGNGTDDNNRSNLFVIDGEGNLSVQDGFKIISDENSELVLSSNGIDIKQNNISLASFETNGIKIGETSSYNTRLYSNLFGVYQHDDRIFTISADDEKVEIYAGTSTFNTTSTNGYSESFVQALVWHLQNKFYIGENNINIYEQITDEDTGLALETSLLSDTYQVIKVLGINGAPIGSTNSMSGNTKYIYCLGSEDNYSFILSEKTTEELLQRHEFFETYNYILNQCYIGTDEKTIYDSTTHLATNYSLTRTLTEEQSHTYESDTEVRNCIIDTSNNARVWTDDYVNIEYNNHNIQYNIYRLYIECTGTLNNYSFSVNSRYWFTEQYVWSDAKYAGIGSYEIHTIDPDSGKPVDVIEYDNGSVVECTMGGVKSTYSNGDIVISGNINIISGANYQINDVSIFDIFYPVGSYYDTSDSSFDPNTSLGGTWTSEQIKDDEIVEQSTNSIWTYRKWKSGIAECWGRRDITISLNNNYGGAYYGTDAVGFPTGLFSAEPTVSISRQGREGTGLVHISPYSVSSTQIQYFITNTNGVYNSAPIGIAINARGLWKTYSAPTTKYRWHRTA